MLIASVVLFALVAVLGVSILVKWLNNASASRVVVYSHGAVAAVALVLLIVYALENSSNLILVSTVTFVVAALGGFYMFFRDLQGKNSPMSIAYLHAALAVGGFVV